MYTQTRDSGLAALVQLMFSQLPRLARIDKGIGPQVCSMWDMTHLYS